MKISDVLKEMQDAYRQADQAFHHGNYQGSVDNYKKALQLCQSLPPEQEFDRPRFEASVHAGLSGALGRLEKHMESFAAANMALAFYDQCGENYPADTGRWLMAQVNQGAALAALGCFPASIEALKHAKQIFTDKCLDPTKNAEWLKMVNGNIAAITAQMEKAQR